MGLEESRVVRTSVPLGDGTGLYRLGSGYLIADGLVLTAAHVLARADGAVVSAGQAAEVAGPGGDWEQASVAWADAGRDVAVLACPALRAERGVRWGRLAGPDPLDWGAVGFPAASATREAGRQAEHAFGRTSPISERAAGTLALTIESRDPASRAGGSPWAGLSGAAVFCGEHLAGVITADTGGYDRSLTARRADDFCHDPDLAAVLGGTPVLEQVTGRPREPGLADLRSTLRPRNLSFTGRDADLAALAADPAGRVVLTQSLTGLGGVGKSALALEYAHRRYDAGDADLAWWFTAEDRPVLLAAMAGLYDRLTGTPGDQDAEAGRPGAAELAGTRPLPVDRRVRQRRARHPGRHRARRRHRAGHHHLPGRRLARHHRAHHRRPAPRRGGGPAGPDHRAARRARTPSTWPPSSAAWPWPSSRPPPTSARPAAPTPTTSRRCAPTRAPSTKLTSPGPRASPPGSGSAP